MTARDIDVAVAEPIVTRLPDGRHLVVRAATAADVDGLVALYAGLDDDDTHRRFFSMFRPDRSFFERLAAAGEHGGDEIVVTVAPADGDGPEQIVAEAGYRVVAGGDGELAMAVARPWRGWLGPYLFGILRRRAAAHGVRNLRAEVLATNRPMVAVLSRPGSARLDDDDYAIVRLLIGTSGPTPTWPAGGARRRLLVEVPGGRWHGTAAARAAGFDVITCCGPRGEPARCPALHGERCPLVTDADVVVIHPRDDEQWRALATAHETVHAGIPILVETGGGEDVLAAIQALLGGATSDHSAPAASVSTYPREIGGRSTQNDDENTPGGIVDDEVMPDVLPSVPARLPVAVQLPHR
ncbi:MAG TPA: hypothetical protein VM262_09510 [Acidimicrobiales bacterium]|nr:hypothetical protein [Acidimicrobiales bacterium]